MWHTSQVRSAWARTQVAVSASRDANSSPVSPAAGLVERRQRLALTLGVAAQRPPVLRESFFVFSILDLDVPFRVAATTFLGLRGCGCGFRGGAGRSIPGNGGCGKGGGRCCCCFIWPYTAAARGTIGAWRRRLEVGVKLRRRPTIHACFPSVRVVLQFGSVRLRRRRGGDEARKSEEREEDEIEGIHGSNLWARFEESQGEDEEIENLFQLILN